MVSTCKVYAGSILSSHSEAKNKYCLTKIAMVNMNVPQLSVGGPPTANEIISHDASQTTLLTIISIYQISLAFLLCCHASADV